MKLLSFYLLLVTLALAASTVTSNASDVPSLKANRSVYTASNGTVISNAVALNWTLAPGDVQGYEVERRLFPYLWSHVGQSRDGVWVDAKPSKRASWYRVRALFSSGKGKWSPKAYAPPVS